MIKFSHKVLFVLKRANKVFTKLSEQDMKDEIDQLIDQRQDLLQIQDLVREARRDWYSNTYSGEYTGD